SLDTSVGFSGHRSTNTPAIGPMKTIGSIYAICKPVTWAAVPCMRKVTTAITAKSARKSPNRLITWAYHTRRMTSLRSTSRNVSGGGGAAAAVAVDVDMGSDDY